MLLKHYGIDIDMKEYVDNYLPKEEVYEKDGLRYGPDPSKYYAGDPSDSSRGWGTFLPVIKNSLYTIFKNKLPESTVGHVYTSDDKLPLEEYVQNGNPVLVWTTTNYSEAKDIYEWFSYDKSRTYTYPKNAHVVVIVGMDKNYYYINSCTIFSNSSLSKYPTCLSTSSPFLKNNKVGIAVTPYLIAHS